MCGTPHFPFCELRAFTPVDPSDFVRTRVQDVSLTRFAKVIHTLFCRISHWEVTPFYLRPRLIWCLVLNFQLIIQITIFPVFAAWDQADMQ